MARTARRTTLAATILGPGPVPMTLSINGVTRQLEVEPRRSLLDVLRDDLGLTGAKRVCNLGECGACTVLIDGRPRYSCITLAIDAALHRITTIEGLAVNGQLDPIQEAFIRADALQCGYCTPGQILAAKGLLTQNPHPSDAEIRAAMAGNLCRCGAYAHILDAIHCVSQGGAKPADGGSTP